MDRSAMRRDRPLPEGHHEAGRVAEGVGNVSRTVRIGLDTPLSNEIRLRRCLSNLPNECYRLNVF